MDIFEHRKIFFAVLILVFFFRLWFGLSNLGHDDEKQIYLIGLKYYTTGAWPYYGPDVDYPNGLNIQLPGALQGLLVGLPFFAFPIPEAPFILINILSFLSLCFFSWYCTKRLPGIPQWFVWLWLLTAPWTLNISSNIYNLSYVLVGSICFFTGALETYPFTRRSLISLRVANFLMGAALFWVMQLHMSWVILLPFGIGSIYFQYSGFFLDDFPASGRNILSSLMWFAAGALLTASLLLPTYLRYGFWEGLGGTNSTVELNLTNLLNHFNIAEGILSKFLSFASFNIQHFIRGDRANRYALLREQPWVIPFALFIGIVGVLQPIVMLVMWFTKKRAASDWTSIKYVTLFTVGLLYVSFLFTPKEPQSHTFYLTLPIAMLYGFYCWHEFLKSYRWRVFAGAVLLCGIVFHTALGIYNYGHVSIYLDRRLPQSAIANKDYRIFGERRPGVRY